MSIWVEYCVLPRRTSGGRYHSVTTSFEYVLVGTDLALAKPKSPNFEAQTQEYISQGPGGFRHSRISRLTWSLPSVLLSRLSVNFVVSSPGVEYVYDGSRLILATAGTEVTTKKRREELKLSTHESSSPRPAGTHLNIIQIYFVVTLFHVLLQVFIQILENES